jgi:hypothetical protein
MSEQVGPRPIACEVHRLHATRETVAAAVGSVDGRPHPAPPAAAASTPTNTACRALISGVVVLLILLKPLASAQDARQIVDEAQKRSRANSEHYEGLLQVIDAKGKITEKQWIFDRLGSHGNSKSVIRFTAPAEVKGVALLVVNHPERASDQWMWTPAIARDRRIALQDRSTRFFGTDFSFEDLEERDVDQYEHRLIGQEKVEEALCWRIESRPKGTKVSQYTSSHLWIRQDNYAFQQIENFVKDQAVRRLKYSEITEVQGIWSAHRLEMSDLRRKSRTILRLDDLTYDAPMNEDDFTLQALRRER